MFEDNVKALTEMGFDGKKARIALEKRYTLHSAVDYLTEQQEKEDQAAAAAAAAGSGSAIAATSPSFFFKVSRQEVLIVLS